MENLLKYLEEKVDERRLLNEASEIELTKDIFDLYAKVFENLSDAFYDMSNKSNVDGNGKVYEDLIKVGKSVNDLKSKLKTVKNSKDKEKFDSSVNKAIGEIGNSLKILKNKVERDLVPVFEVSREEFVPDEEVSDEEEILGK